MVTKRFLVFVLGLTGLMGCGDDPASVVAECVTADDCPGSFVCLDGKCIQPTGIPDAGPTDLGPGADTKTQDTKVTDTKPFDPGPAPDLIPDNEPPTVATVVPADGQMGVELPFKVTLTFSEPVKNVEKNTVQLVDINGLVLEGVWAAGDDGKTFEFTPKASDLVLGSPYTLSVNFPTQVILDAAGNKMQGIAESRFFSAVQGNREKYDGLADKYAPNIRITAADNNYPFKANFELPTKLNVDGDWDLKDNVDYLTHKDTKSIKPYVHYSVLESESHYYIHYVMYWSRRENLFPNEEADFRNDTAGSVVVVEKFGDKRPVEVLTWFKDGPGEYIRAYTTTESGIQAGDGGCSAIDAIMDQATLFPNDRYNAFVAAARHQSCVWDDDGQDAGLVNTCELSSFEKEFYNLYELSPGPTATTIQKNGASWPEAGVAQYQLVDLLPEWWPRRTQFDTLFFDSIGTYTHTTDDDSFQAKFPRNFVDENLDQGEGRTPWGLKWSPSDGQCQAGGQTQGMFFIDTARFLSERHGTDYFTTAFNAADKTGFSTSWCFNPYLGIDIRGTGDVCP